MDTNKKVLLGMVAMALAFGMAVIGCNNGTVDETGGKPKTLAAGATYQQALNKCDEIITYCGSNSANTGVYASVLYYKQTLTQIGSGSWSTMSVTTIDTINFYINSLQ